MVLSEIKTLYNKCSVILFSFNLWNICYVCFCILFYLFIYVCFFKQAFYIQHQHVKLKIVQHLYSLLHSVQLFWNPRINVNNRSESVILNLQSCLHPCLLNSENMYYIPTCENLPQTCIVLKIMAFTILLCL